MEDDLNYFLNGRRPQFLFVNGRRPQLFASMENDLKFVLKWKTTSILVFQWNTIYSITNERQPQIFFANGRRPKLFLNRRQPQFFCKLKMTSIYLVNGRQPCVF